jgi:hypothetical protein
MLVLRAALPRILAILGVLVGGTAAISATLGELGGASIARSLATGYYLVGAAVLLASFAFGSRGPWRTETNQVDEETGALRPRPSRRRRKATPEERAEGRRNSVGLFVLGVALVVLGAVIDPSRRAF